LRITPNWDELTPASAGFFFFHPSARPVNMTVLVRPNGFAPIALCTGTGPAMQKPIATLAVGGLINATLLTRSSSSKGVASVSDTQ
jgi:multidrug efflux pump subunit AcrB